MKLLGTVGLHFVLGIATLACAAQDGAQRAEATARAEAQPLLDDDARAAIERERVRFLKLASFDAQRRARTLAPEIELSLKAANPAAPHTIATDALRRSYAADGIDLSTAPIEDAVMLLFFLVADDAEADLRAAMQNLEAANERKRAVRSLAAQLKQLQAGLFQGHALPSVGCPVDRSSCFRLLVAEGPSDERLAHALFERDLAAITVTDRTTLGELDRVIEVLDAKQSDVDALTRQDEIELQISTDRKAQFESILSSLVEVAARTSDSIISNIK